MRIFVFSLVILTFVWGYALAGGDNYYDYPVLSVYDGDTVTVHMEEIPRGFYKQKLRLAGIDTPEIRGKCQYEKDLAKKSRDYLRSAISSAKRVKFKVIDQGVYGRYIVHLYVDGRNINEELVEVGLARSYDGKTARKGWCDGK